MYSTNFTYRLKKELSGNLPGSASHLKMMPEGRKNMLVPEIKSSVKKSSVLVILYPEGQSLFCILTKRPLTMKNHAGQVSFPGGMVEKSDKSFVEAALREANEEIGINKESIEILGSLSKLFVQISNFLILPFVAWSNKKPNLSRNKFEVEKIIHFPLSNFFDNKKIATSKQISYSAKIDVPCYFYQEEVIWGATAMILSELIDILKQFNFVESDWNNADNY